MIISMAVRWYINERNFICCYMSAYACIFLWTDFFCFFLLLLFGLRARCHLCYASHPFCYFQLLFHPLLLTLFNLSITVSHYVPFFSQLLLLSVHCTSLMFYMRSVSDNNQENVRKMLRVYQWLHMHICSSH